MKFCPALPRHSVSYKWNGKEATRLSSETGQSIFQEWKSQNLPQVCFGDMSHGVNLRHRRNRLGRRRRRCGGERWEGEASWCSTIYPPLCHVFAQQIYHKRCDLLLVLITCLSKTRELLSAPRSAANWACNRTGPDEPRWAGSSRESPSSVSVPAFWSIFVILYGHKKFVIKIKYDLRLKRHSASKTSQLWNVTIRFALFRVEPLPRNQIEHLTIEKVMALLWASSLCRFKVFRNEG